MVESFSSIIDKQCTTLILGSTPGIKSLELDQYYAHPRNYFWRIIYALFGAEYEEAYEEAEYSFNEGIESSWEEVDEEEWKENDGEEA